MRRIDISEVSALALGAAVLGTGGGGNPYTSRLALCRQTEMHGREPILIDLEAVPDDALVVSVGMGGSPSVGVEKLLSESYASEPIRKLEEVLGRSVDAIMPIEVGGTNSLLPLLAGAALNLPVIDADGMGRAFPTLDKTVFSIGGVSPFPMAVFDAHGETLIFESELARAYAGERIVRAAIVAMGGACACALYPMTGRQAKDMAIPRTMSLALGIGRAIIGARRGNADPFEALLSEIYRHDSATFGGILFDGKVIDLERDMVGGYNIGSGVLEGQEAFDGTLSFAFQNEFLYAKRDNTLVAIVPDLIGFLDRETAEPITCELLRYGHRVKVIGLGASPHLRTPAALKVCGPGAFGLTDEYLPIEALSSDRASIGLNYADAGMD